MILSTNYDDMSRDYCKGQTIRLLLMLLRIFSGILIFDRYVVLKF